MMQAIYSGKSPRIRSLVATGEKTMTNEFKIFSDDPKYASQNPTDLSRCRERAQRQDSEI